MASTPSTQTPMQKAAQAQMQKDALNKQRLDSIGLQVSKLEAAPEAITQAETANIQNIRRDQGAILARGRGLLGGGGGLAMLRSAAQQRQGQETDTRANFEMQRQAAIEKAAAARTEYLGEQQKSADAEAIRSINAQKAVARAQEILQAEEKAQYFTWNEEDRNRTADAILAEYANETDPIVLKAVQDYAYKVRTGQIGGAGVINT